MATKDLQFKEQLAGAAALAQQLSRESLGTKPRVHALAKQLGVASKVLIYQFGQLGIEKKPQSTVSPAEVDNLFAALEELAPRSTEAEDNAAVELVIPSAELATELSDALVPDLNGDPEEFTEDDRLRYRVLKNVENELHQIVDKVDAELADATELTDAIALTDTTELVDDAKLSDEDGQASETVTTQPAVEVFAPVFIAPEIDEPTVAEAVEVDGDETQEEDTANTFAETKESTKKRRRGGRGTSRGRGKDRKVE
ncbi:MAG: translation initiation factor IF-2 N-terminal domain-containing protein, partial [Corynebacterium sp.]|nr:translation initiation factor IF-2 N-terminal domain-containing protein [Corynebacterium sp.]